MESMAGYIGAVCLLLAGYFAYWRKKRRFERVNQYGVERFRSFGAKVAAHTKEGLALFAAILLAITGLVLVGYQFQDSWGWVILLPASLLALFFLVGA